MPTIGSKVMKLASLINLWRGLRNCRKCPGNEPFHTITLEAQKLHSIFLISRLMNLFWAKPCKILHIGTLPLKVSRNDVSTSLSFAKKLGKANLHCFGLPSFQPKQPHVDVYNTKCLDLRELRYMLGELTSIWTSPMGHN